MIKRLQEENNVLKRKRDEDSVRLDEVRSDPIKKLKGIVNLRRFHYLAHSF